MTDYVLSEATRAKFKKISTASIATALFKRGLRNQFIQGVVPVSSKSEVMVGQAFTLRYIPAREDRNPITVFRNADHPQRVAVETCPPGHGEIGQPNGTGRAKQEELVGGDRRFERMIGVVAPVGQQPVYANRIDDCSGQDMRANLGALLHHDDRQLRIDLLQADRR